MKTTTKHTTLSDQIEGQIYEYIRAHHLTWDDPLPKEEELAAELAVSRTVIREALSRLKAAGVIESRRRRGMVLQKPDSFNHLGKLIRFGLLDDGTRREFAVLRVVLEIGLADLVYRNRNAAALAHLEAIADQFLARGINRAGHDRLETEFHAVLFEMSGNEVIASFQALLSPLFLNQFQDDLVPAETGEHDHRHLVEILKNGSLDEWREAIRQHLIGYL